MKILTVLFFSLIFSVAAAAQRPLGSVNNVQPAACTAGFIQGSACFSATISCPQVADISVQFGIKGNPTAGTIVFINGTGDTLPGGSPSFFTTYSQAGFSLAQFAFATDWEGGGNILASACRPATMLEFLRSTPNLPFCVQAASGGAGGTAYALSWYGVAIDNAEMLSGPVFSSVAEGCRTPHASPVTINPTNGVPFDDIPFYNQESSQVSSWTNTSCLPPNPSTRSTLANESAQSIVQPGAVLSFPATKLSGWVCNNGQNPSAAQAYLWFSQIATPWSLTSISDCQGAEGVAEGTTPQGTPGSEAIAEDMIRQCVKTQ
ncbi:MAG TPA: hypothetical protein VND65_22385 [Candidatus Binatia bacterium]|nr:hypothetical protein [Candidatus Binatia bacterium]